MNKAIYIIALAVSFCQCSGKVQNASAQTEGKDSVAVIAEALVDTLPEGVKILMRVYPSQIIGYADNNLMMANGERIVYDDRKEKDFMTMLDNSDPEDMFKMRYDQQSKVPLDKMSDAGRSRCEQLFKAMYGHSSTEAQHKFSVVNWFGQQIRFTTVNGAADSLRSVAREIANHPEMLPYMRQSSSFYWRPVRGAKRLSAHSYGIAIDINTSYSNYWLWSNASAKETDKIRYANRIPLEIVKIFERHGFIWGGRWYHYDTMHFEFRPEFLYK